jgi:diacylglycerol kinase (ATP)
MRVALVHNRSAGQRIYETRELERLLCDAGHEVETFASEDVNVTDAVRTEPHVVVAAGGDGTVAKVAIAIHQEAANGKDKRPAIFVLPIGTSNNIARSLRVAASVPELLSALSHARSARLDIGVVSASWGRESFVEGAGFGFIGEMLERDGSVRERLARARRAVAHTFRRKPSHEEKVNRGVARLVRQQPAGHYRVCADGEDLSGEYIAIEAMNTREIGPHVSLAPNARTDDGLLDLLLVRPEDREALAQHVESGEDSTLPPGLVRQVRKIELTWPNRGGHVDDEPRRLGKDAKNDGGDSVTIAIGGTIEVLLPP